MLCENKELSNFIDNTINNSWVPRFFVDDVTDYLQGKANRVLVISGLRGTGKTVGILQAIQPVIDNTLFISPDYDEELSAYSIIDEVKHTTKKFIVLDEFTWITDFIKLAIILPGLVQQGKRIIVSGTDSITIESLKFTSFIHRARIIHTTFFSYPEYCVIFSKEPSYQVCKEYLMFGGLFEDYILKNIGSVREYLKDSVISSLVRYMPSIDEKVASAVVYSILYNCVCNNTIQSVPYAKLNGKSYEEFVEEFGINSTVVIDTSLFEEVSSILENIGFIVRLDNLRFRGQYRTYIVNSSLTYQLVKCVYYITTPPESVFGYLFEAASVSYLVNNLDRDKFTLYYLEGRKEGFDFEIDFIAKESKYTAFIFDMKMSNATVLPDNASLVKDVIERYLSDYDSIERIILYNGETKTEQVNNKEVFYTSDYNELASKLGYPKNESYAKLADSTSEKYNMDDSLKSSDYF